MLACGDAGVTLHAIAGPPLGQAPAERAAALRERPDVTALLAFLLSDEHLSLRSRLGMRLD